MSNRRRGRVRTERPLERRSEAAKPPREPSKPTLNRYNIYKCPSCGGAWLTVDLDEGVTPMFSPCFATQGCGGTATSMGYPEGPPPNLPLLIEWYKPMRIIDLDHEVKDHIRKGGLMRRATRGAAEWVKRLA